MKMSRNCIFFLILLIYFAAGDKIIMKVHHNFKNEVLFMKNFVITVERGFGSGGKTIGQSVAKQLGIKYYDEEILKMASDESGINEKYFIRNDEKVKLPVFARRGVFEGGVIPPDSKEFASEENLFNYQAHVMRKLAATESFVAIGRASNFVLADLDNVFSFNIQAPFDVCVKTVCERFSLSPAQAEKRIKKTDKERADFYYYYTGKRWSDSTQFDLCLNSDRIGWDGCAELIIEYVKNKIK